MKTISDAYFAASMRVDGHLSKIELMENLARLNGEENDITPARLNLWISGAMSIYVDNVRRFMLAHFHESLVCSTVSMVFVPGEWEKLIEPYRQKIEEIVKREEQARTNQMIAESLRIPALVI